MRQDMQTHSQMLVYPIFDDLKWILILPTFVER